jgi:hypothetical protein
MKPSPLLVYSLEEGGAEPMALPDNLVMVDVAYRNVH